MDKKLIENFIENANLHSMGTSEGNYKIANTASKKLTSIIHKLKKDHSVAENFIDHLIKNDNPSLIIWLSLLGKEIDYKYDIFYEKLNKIANDKSLKFLSFDAQIMLKEIYNQSNTMTDVKK